jgi:hypothetical protein
VGASQGFVGSYLRELWTPCCTQNACRSCMNSARVHDTGRYPHRRIISEGSSEFSFRDARQRHSRLDPEVTHLSMGGCTDAAGRTSPQQAVLAQLWVGAVQAAWAPVAW